MFFFFFFQAEDGIRDLTVTGVQTCALPISWWRGPGAEMEFPRRLSSDWRDRGSSFFFQRHLPVVTEQVAPELELFDRWRKCDVDWHDLDSAHTILNIRARVKNRSRTRNSHNNVFAVTEINFAF